MKHWQDSKMGVLFLIWQEVEIQRQITGAVRAGVIYNNIHPSCFWAPVKYCSGCAKTERKTEVYVKKVSALTL